MATTTLSQTITLTTGEATTFNLRSIFTGSTIVYQQGRQDFLAWTVHTADNDIPEWHDVVQVDGDTLSLTAPDQTYRQFYILLYYFDDPDEILRINVTDVVLPTRDPLMPDDRAMADIVMWGIGSRYNYPTVDFFTDPHTPITPTISGNTQLVVAAPGRITSVLPAPGGAEPATVTVGRYSFRATVVLPALSDTQVAVPGEEMLRAPSATRFIISPSAELAIPAGVIFSAIPAAYKEGIVQSNVLLNVLQGQEICRIVNNELRIGQAGVAHDARNYTVSVQLQDSANSNAVFYTLRCWASVTNMEGRTVQNPFPPWHLVPNENPTAGGNTIPGNPPPLGSTLYLNAVHPPPVRDGQIVERKFNGMLPDRLPIDKIGVVVGQIEQEGTGTTIGLADPRRQQKVTPQQLMGGIYDVPRVIPDDFWVEWPHHVREENA